jgi:hypothetical protein
MNQKTKILDQQVSGHAPHQTYPFLPALVLLVFKVYSRSSQGSLAEMDLYFVLLSLRWSI